MSRHVRVAVLVFIFIVIVSVVIIFLSYRLVHRTLPQANGEIAVGGISHRVRIYRDSFGVPCFFAKNEADLYFALGFVHAQERLWQMELYRRAATGTISEIIGERALKLDKFVRVLGFPALAEQLKTNLSRQSLFILENYARGVNAFIEQNSSHLPIEFTILNFRPEKWKIEHSIAIQRLLAWSLEMGWFVDPAFAILATKIDRKKFAEILPVPEKRYFSGALKLTNQEGAFFSNFLDCCLELKKFTGLRGAGFGSNAWVVSGDRTQSGEPLLANDPHLWMLNPSIWFEAQLHAPELNCSGFTIPGLPGIIIGQNQAIAWGMTNMMADGCDYFQEKLHPQDSLRYFYRGKWQKMDVFDDTIFVKDKEPVIQKIRLSAHGPIVSSLDSSLASVNQAISLQWIGKLGKDEFLAFDRIMKASNWDEFVSGLQNFGVPPQNFLYADTSGNIGYYAAGTIPVRKRGRGILLRPGWDKRYDWQGTIPFDQLPHWVNPDSGIIISANQKMVDDRYPYFISDYWEPDYRWKRIWQMISAQEKLSAENFKKMQSDRLDLHAQYLLPFILPVLEKFNRSDRHRNYFYQELKNWDHVVSEESVGAAIFEVFLVHFYEDIFQDEMGADLYKEFVQLPNLPIRIVDKIIKQENNPWFDNVLTKEVAETRDDIILKSLERTFKFFPANYSEDVGRWRWGNVHQLELKHILGYRKPLNAYFNIRSFPVGGSNTTVNAGMFALADKKMDMTVGASLRQIVDFSQLDEPLHILPSGQSGHPLSKNYSDQTELWRKGEYRSVMLDTSYVVESAKSLLTLVPSKN